MGQSTCCQGNDVMVFACSGGSNVGQITNQAAIELDKAGVARFFCLAGVAPLIEGMVKSAQSAKTVIALDGCSVACAKEGLNRAGIDIHSYVVVTDLGVEKNRNFDLKAADVQKTVEAAKSGMPAGA